MSPAFTYKNTYSRHRFRERINEFQICQSRIIFFLAMRFTNTTTSHTESNQRTHSLRWLRCCQLCFLITVSHEPNTGKKKNKNKTKFSVPFICKICFSKRQRSKHISFKIHQTGRFSFLLTQSLNKSTSRTEIYRKNVVYFMKQSLARTLNVTMLIRYAFVINNRNFIEAPLSTTCSFQIDF